jgi:3-hydroxyisobutyrate dehydrogenase
MSAIELENAPDDGPRLSMVLDDCWGLLSEAVRDREHGFRTPTVATSSRDHGVSLRTVVLRHVERENRLISFHTDARSRKFAELLDDPRLAIVFYDAPELTQLRVQATARVHHGNHRARRVWDEVALGSRRCYLQEGPPGLPWGWPHSGLPPELEESPPNAEDSERGFTNFAVVDCAVTRIDWLYLSHAGHRRAIFTYDETGGLKANWVLP